MPRPRPFKGIQGWSQSTRNPNTNNTVLNSSKEAVYCFQFCGPLFNRASIQRTKGNGRYFPSIIQAKYLLSGIANNVVTTKIEMGRIHIVSKPLLLLVVRKRPGSEPFRTNQSNEQVNKEQ